MISCSGTVRDLRSSIAFSALYSCTKSRTPARKTVKKITTASNSPLSRVEIIEAAIRKVSIYLIISILL